MTLSPSGRAMPAPAVEEASVPARGVLCATTRAPFSGVSVTCSVVPGLMFEAARATLTGLGWLAGNTMSGPPWREPLGWLGGATPATEPMRVGGRGGGGTRP